MLAVLIDFCLLDDLPVDQSKAYQQLVNICGTDVANKFVQERECIVIPHRGDADERRPP